MRRDARKKNRLVILVIAVLLFIIAVLTYRGAQTIRTNEQAVAVPEPVIAVPEVLFAAIDVEATSAIVFDINEGKVLFSKNEFEKRPLASVTKLMTIYAANSLLQDQSTITISQLAYDTYGESGFFPRESWGREALQKFVLISSSNDGATALAEAAGATLTTNPNSQVKVDAFVSYMNSFAKKIGLTQTSFSNPTGLDYNDTVPQAFGSASDIAELLSYIMIENPSVLEASSEKRMTFSEGGKQYVAQNTNDIIGLIPGLIVSKTGFTDAAGGNLVVVYDSGLNRPITIVVFGSTREGRFADVQKLVEHTQDYFTRKALVENF